MASRENVDFLKLVRPSVPLRELAAEKLKEAIVMGLIKPGERLVEATLAKRMGVSRPSIREALSQLAAEKLVTMTPNRGPSVATISWDDAAQIYSVRNLLEGEAAFLFAQRAKKADLVLMARALRDFERAIAHLDTAKLLSSTEDFYQVILDGCGNRILVEILQGLNARIGVLRFRSMSRAGRARHSHSEMIAMLLAFEQRDPQAARQATSYHVSAAAAAARESFNEAPVEPLAG
jgi:DNA-binding GntR family transcriptional regulator